MGSVISNGIERFLQCLLKITRMLSLSIITVVCILSDNDKTQTIVIFNWTFTIALLVYPFPHSLVRSSSFAPLASSPDISSISYLPSSKIGHHMTITKPHCWHSFPFVFWPSVSVLTSVTYLLSFSYRHANHV